jgi:hypothetical protein
MRDMSGVLVADDSIVACLPRNADSGGSAASSEADACHELDT